jgi:hypothetical protein
MRFSGKCAFVSRGAFGAPARARPVTRAGRLENIAAAFACRASDDPAFVLDAHILVNGNLTNDTRARWAPAQPSIFAAREAFG